MLKRATLQIAAAIAIAAVCVAGFRALAFTIYTVEGTALAPELWQGDRIVVNRWSYGLRTGGRDGLFRYGRAFARPVEKGDIVAFDCPVDSLGGVCVGRCKAVAGDTVSVGGDAYVVPGHDVDCSDENHYWMEAVGDGGSMDSRTFGPVPESCVIGRVCMVLYSRDPSQPFYDGFRAERTLLAK